ncbi:MAG: hypothetical protein IEMM0001_0367 [bacterium]|nr:MAG: hypothetical protein IEMM0001_0367 [bacterium]
MKKKLIWLFTALIVGAVTTANASIIEVPSVSYSTITDNGRDGSPDYLLTSSSDPIGHLGWVSNANISLGSAPNWNDVTFIDFDVSGLTDTVSSAVLGFQTRRDQNGTFGRPIRISSYDANGVPELSDYTLAQIELGIIYNPSSYGTTLLTFDVTSTINSLIGASDFAGFAFSTYGPNSQIFIQGVPTLGITPAVVPEPTTLALFGIGLAGLGFARRKKSA